MEYPVVTKREINYFRNKLLAWSKHNHSNFPWRITANKWHALVAEIMLQRTRTDQVLPVYESFVLNYPSPEHYYKSSNSSVFSTLGLRWREPILKSLSESLITGDIPCKKAALVELPGIGEYIASAFLSFHCGKREFIIDSNVVRLYGRFLGFRTDGETRRRKWFIELADTITPKRKYRDFNYAIIDYTRQVCKTKPACLNCILARKCKLSTKKLRIRLQQ